MSDHTDSSTPKCAVPLRRAGSTGNIPTSITDMALPAPQSYRYSDSFADGRDRVLPSSSTAANGPVLPSLTDFSLIAPSPPLSPTPPPRRTQDPVEDAAQERPVLTDANETPQRRRRSLYVKTAAFLGYGRGSTRTRKELISLIFNLSWAFMQVVVIVTIVGLSTRLKSPTSPGLTEWKACDRLGVWSSIWVLRVFYSWVLGYWNWVRNHEARIRADLESSSETNGNAPSSSVSNPTRVPPRRASIGPATTHASPASEDTPVAVPHSVMYSRLTLLSSLLTVTWFLTAHILIYTSLNTCRHAAPHLWWLTFSILCIMYVMVLEIVILGVVVFVIAPVLFLFWNIILICIGRHPLQHPAAIRPEIVKLSRSVVDRIPLVMYIPPPPDEPVKDGVRIPEAAYTYPPITPTLPAQKRRFKWWKRDLASLRKGKGGDADREKKGGDMNEKAIDGEDEAAVWEENWEQGEYPFVRLEGNRAACAICLMDFEEPKRVRGVTVAEGKENVNGGEEGAIEQQVREAPVEVYAETAEQLKLSDAGEGPQPLRLLACGHVFHKTCLDPWLEKVSGRCPVCQRAVELPEVDKKPRRGRGIWRRG